VRDCATKKRWGCTAAAYEARYVEGAIVVEPASKIEPLDGISCFLRQLGRFNESALRQLGRFNESALRQLGRFNESVLRQLGRSYESALQRLSAWGLTTKHTFEAAEEEEVCPRYTWCAPESIVS
jgi:hypothetical protein